MVKVKSPFVREMEYASDSLVNLKNQLKYSEHKNERKLLFDYPVVYIVNDENKNQFSVYVGETTDIIRRTSQHLIDDIKKDDRDDWRDFATSSTTKMFVIGHNHFNKSLTLDIENRLMLYLSSVENVKRVHNRKENPQNEYYTSDELDSIFLKIWYSLRKRNKYLFPAESIVRNSAIFKASPFHKLTEEQIEAKNSIINKISGNRINFEEPIILHKNVWIGTGASLLKGSEIPEWCIVGAKTVVSKKFHIPNTIIVGNPAKEVKSNIEWRMERIKKN